MREILFRGKTKETGEWRYGFVAKHKYDFETEEVFVIENEKGYWAEVIPETVGQFTGLIDKNGNKIFEGDIIEFKNIDRQYVKGIVYYLGSCFLIESIVADEDDYNLGGVFSTAEGLIKVIGNIHENPDGWKEVK